MNDAAARRYPPTWYAATLERAVHYPAVAGRIEVETCVIGAGLAGLTTALELARAGRSVALIEAESIAWGASGRNGGFVSPGFALGISGITKRVGAERMRSLHALSREGHEYVRREVQRLAPSAMMGEGWLVALRHPDASGLAEDQQVLQRELATPTELWPRGRVRSVLKSERYFAGLYHPEAFHIHPLQYAVALAGEAVRLGARVHEGTRVARIEGDRPAYRVVCPKGEVIARHVALCTSAFDRHLLPRMGRGLLPVATYVAVTEPLGKGVEAAIATPAAISDTRRAGDYYRVVGDGRVLWGGRITTRRSEPAHLKEIMRGDMVSVYPQLASARIDYAWGGLMGYALHKMPLVGRAGDGLWMAAGFGGHGLNTTAMAGCLIARAIAAGDDAYRQLEAFPPQWVGGPLGQAGVQLSYWGMQARDRWEERRR